MTSSIGIDWARNVCATIGLLSTSTLTALILPASSAATCSTIGGQLLTRLAPVCVEVHEDRKLRTKNFGFKGCVCDRLDCHFQYPLSCILDSVTIATPALVPSRLAPRRDHFFSGHDVANSAGCLHAKVGPHLRAEQSHVVLRLLRRRQIRSRSSRTQRLRRRSIGRRAASRRLRAGRFPGSP